MTMCLFLPQKLTKDFSLHTLVREMRRQRVAMVQTTEQYILVHRAVRELFREQLRVIDSHPYENIDVNGALVHSKVDEEPLYESVRTVDEPKKAGQFTFVSFLIIHWYGNIVFKSLYYYYL